MCESAYLGCREFAASFRLVHLADNGRGSVTPVPGEPEAWTEWTADLGWMLHDMDFASGTPPQPRFFRAYIERGVMDLSGAEVRG